MRIWHLFFIPCLAIAAETMLSEAEELSRTYSQQIARAAPPSRFPLPESCLMSASVWFSVDLETLQAPPDGKALDVFLDEGLWGAFKELGIDGLCFEHLRGKEGLGIDPKWGGNWAKISNLAEKRGISLIGDLIGNATAPGLDFQKAIQNEESYASLYNLVEIDKKDWKLLPNVGTGKEVANVPWLTVQELHKRGYVPENYTPYVKESDWNATPKIRCADGRVRRWIYLKEGVNNPTLAWMNPTFAAYQLAAGDAIEGAFKLGERVLRVDGKLPKQAQEMLSLWVRKLGAYTALETNGFIEQLASASTDMIYDTATRPALLHAILAEDAEALRMTYQLFIDEGIAANRLVHSLQPFDSYVCDWVHLMSEPKRKFRYFENQVTADVLRKRLLKEDMARLESPERIPMTTWVDYCARSLQIKDFEKSQDLLTRSHLLLAFAYAMQPGAFSFSAADLLGALPEQAVSIDLTSANSNTLYSSLPTQMRNKNSFANRLKLILAARRDANIAAGELVEVPPAAHKGTLLLLHRLPGSRFLYLLAVNFSRATVEESLEMAEIRNTWPIDALTHLAEEKVFSSGRFSFMLPPLSGRAFIFQPKYYD